MSKGRFVAKQSGDYYDCVFPYDAEMVDQIKELIPRSERWWDPQTRCWSIHGDYLTEILHQARRLGFTIPRVVQEGDTSDPPPRKAPTNPVSPVAEFAGLLSFETLHRAFRAEAARTHPDRAGGDPERMKKLNSTWDLVKKAFGK